MRKIIPFILALIIFACPMAALADGFVLLSYEDMVYLPARKAVISWDGAKETMLLSTKIKVADLADMAWVIPVPSSEKPEVSAWDIEIFYDLAELFMGERGNKSGMFEFGATDSMSDQVQVVEFKKVDIYDITILKADSAQALTDWLNQNGYPVGDEMAPALENYVAQEDFYFIANKINLKNKYPDITVTAADKLCFEMAEVVTRGYEARWFEEFDFSQISWIFSEVPECDPVGVNPEAVEVLFELDQGVATPLKIEFSPSQAFYPMEISSLNPGQSVVDVYVFSDSPMRDASNLLQVNQMTENPGWADFTDVGFDESMITYLSYVGDLGDLDNDSWFEPAPYEEEIDPRSEKPWYVGLGERETWQYLLSDIYYFITGILLPVAIILLALVGLVVIVKKIARLIKDRGKKK